ncbi:hypothetical protein D3C77_528180 [compost metagenome]
MVLALAQGQAQQHAGQTQGDVDAGDQCDVRQLRQAEHHRHDQQDGEELQQHGQTDLAHSHLAGAVAAPCQVAHDGGDGQQRQIHQRTEPVRQRRIDQQQEGQRRQPQGGALEEALQHRGRREEVAGEQLQTEQAQQGEQIADQGLRHPETPGELHEQAKMRHGADQQ